MKAKQWISGLCIIAMTVGTLLPVSANELEEKGRNLEQQSIQTISDMPDIPSNFEVVDWEQRGIDLDTFLFDYSATNLEEKTVMSINEDRTYSTIYKDDVYGGYMLPAFYGEDRPLNNANNQESIAVTSALIASSLLGVDKNIAIPDAICGGDEDAYLYELLGTDADLTYLDSALKFYWTKDGANVFTNVPNGSDSLLQNKPGVYQAFGDYWYMLIANQNFFRLAALNPEWRPEKIKEIQKSIADKMCDMVDALGGENCDFNIQGFDMINMKSVGTDWRQPDAAAGTANILYYAYKIFGTEKYLTYAKYCMNYLENLSYNPYYENMLIDASYVAAMMNAEVGTDYDVTRYLNWITGSSSVRDWGEVNYSLSGTDITGLTGNCNNDYAFFFNSVYPLTSILLTAKYDPSYAEALGKWALNIVSNTRYFLPDELEADHQTNAEYKDTIEGSVLAYEGFKKTADGNDIGVANGTSMVGTGDAKCNATSGWTAGEYATNLGIYGSVYTGIMGALVEETNVENILRLDCNKTDYYQENMYPTYLYYNPNAEAKEVEISLNDPCDIFDSVTGKYLAKNVSGTQNIKILAQSARVIVLAPANSTKEVNGDVTTINGVLVSRSDANVLPDTGNAAVEEIVIDGADTITKKGTFETYQAVVEPENAEDNRVSWSVKNTDGSETDKASIDADGKLIPKKNGQVIVQAKAMDGSGVTGEKTVTISGQTLPSLSQGKETKTSSVNDGFGGNLAVDGDANTRWIADPNENEPSIEVDLGATADIDSVVINWEAARPNKYKIQVLADGSNEWMDVATIEEPGNSAKVVTIDLENVSGRHVKVYTLDKSQWGCSMYELDVYGTYQIEQAVEEIAVTSESDTNEITTPNKALQMYAEVQPDDATDKRVEWSVVNEDGSDTDLAEITASGKLTPLKNGTVKVIATAADGSVYGETIVTIKNQDLVNLALGKDVEVSKAEGGNPKDGLNDGNNTTRWASGSTDGSDWVVVDLGETYKVNKVLLNWEAAYALKYKIQGSADGENYKDLVEVSNGQGGIEEHDFASTEVRYIKMQGVENRPNLGYSLWELEVYGENTAGGTEEPKDPEADMIGTVNLNGNSDFNSDSVMNDEDSQWRWLGYPESRMVTNYGKRGGQAKYDGGMNLNIAMVVDGFQTKNSLHTIQMGPESGNVGDYQELKTAWYPYKLTADAAYSSGKLHMDEFFVDKDTFVRMIEVTDAADAKLKMSARISGITQSGDDLLIEQDDYWMVYKFLKLDADGNVTGQYTPSVSGEDWSVEISFDTDTAKLAFSLTMLPKNVGENSKESILTQAENTVGSGKNISELLAATKEYWDGKLAKVPAPQNFGFSGNASNGTISAEDHRRAFYAAWAFQYQNIVEPTPEKGYNYYQVTLGIPSTWASGSHSAPNSCSWESLFNIQELSYVEPEIAWDAMKGFIYSIDDNGILDGECLPSQKAHTTWVCYQNMKEAYPEKAEELNAELAQLYPYIYKYLMWRADNPRWIYGHENFENEKDISFVTQWYSDVNYAIKIANILGKYDDVAVYESMKSEMGDNSREWFFAEYDPSQPDTTTNRIMAFCFLNEDGTNSYSWSGSSHNGSSADALNYVYEALFADLPKDLIDQLVHSYLAFTDGKENDPLVGFEFYKYGDGCHTAYGLQEREAQYPELAGKWEEYVDAVLANAIKNVDFAECLRVSGNTTRLEGVEPSSFNASAIIDYTYMKNGVRIDMGEIVALGGDGIAKTDETDVDVYTLKGTKPELPKTVTVEKDGEDIQALVVWPDVTEADYNSDKTTFDVTGQIYGTELTATATVHVHSGDVTIAAQSATTTVGKQVELETMIPAVYIGDDNAEHHGVVEIEWEEITEDMLAQKGIVTVNGTIKFNEQPVTATIGVLAGPAIVCEDSIDKYSSMQLTVVNQDASEEVYQNVQWSIVDPGNDAIAGISSNGTLLAVKPGTVEVQVTAQDQDGNKITAQKAITINNKNIISYGYGTAVTASGTANESSIPDMAVDAKETTWWRAETNDDNQWFQMELQEQIPVSGLKIRWYEGNQPGAIKVLASKDGSAWDEVYTRTTGIESDRENYSEIIVFDTPVDAKYLRMESSRAGDNKTGIVEFEVYSDREIAQQVTSIAVSSDKDTIDKKSETLQMHAAVTPDTATEKRVEWMVCDLDGNATDVAEISADGILTPLKNGTVVVTANATDGSGIVGTKTITITNQDLINIALQKPASAGTNNGEAGKAVDGNLETRWGSSQWPNANWFQVDFEGEYWIHNVAVTFEVSHAKDFKLLVSPDGQTWTELTSVTDNSNLNWRFDLEEPVKANYIKLDVSRTSTDEWGFSIWEFEAYGKSTAVDLTGLNAAIESAQAKDTDKDKYTAESYQAMLSALEEAQALADSDDLTQEAVDAMVQKLSTAITNLVEKVDDSTDKPENPFTDVSEDSKFYDAIIWAYENGITTGKTATTFEPMADCTRGQVVTFLWRAEGCPEPTSTKNPFIDVAETSPFYKAILWAYENGITTGKTATTFQPDVVVTREQFVTFLWRNEGEPASTVKNPFADVVKDRYSTPAILWAYENGITTGKTATTFQPASSVIRQHVVTFLYRAYS